MAKRTSIESGIKPYTIRQNLKKGTIMAKLTGDCREVFEKSEWIAIATTGPQGPHVVATWIHYIMKLGIDGDKLRVPVGGMHKTEANLRHDPRIELLCGTRQIKGAHGPGRGCAIIGRGEVQTEGPELAAVKTEFPWARAVLVIRIEKTELQL